MLKVLLFEPQWYYQLVMPFLTLADAGVPNNPSDGRGNKQPGGTLPEVGNSDGGRGISVSGPSSVNGEKSLAKGSEEGGN